MGSICYHESKREGKKLENKNNEKADNKNEGCFQCNAKIVRKSEDGSNKYKIQINAYHKGDHSCDEQTLDLVFNNPVKFISCTNGKILSIETTTRMKIKLNFHIEPNDNLTVDLIIEYIQNDLEILECNINDGKNNF